MRWLQLRSRLLRTDAAAVGFMFAIAVLPLAMAIGVAVDYGFFIKIKAQLDMAADAAAMHAVRVASQTAGTSQATPASVQQAGQVAGAQWFGPVDK